MKGLHIREKFTRHFQDSDLLDIFTSMCDFIEGTFDPWERINDIKLRFYEFDEDEFDFDSWVINAGQFILMVKAHAMTHEDASPTDVERLCNRFQDTLDGIKNDFLNDERQYYYSFSVLAEFLKYYVKPEITVQHVQSIEGFMETIFDALDAEDPTTRASAVELIVPFVLDAARLHPNAGAAFLRLLDRLIDAIAGDQQRLDETLGLCVRTLSFVDYTTASPLDQFTWASTRLPRLTNLFTSLTSSIHVAIGHALRWEKDKADALLAASLAKSDPLPTPQKEIHLSFLMRGCIEAGIISGATYDAVAKAFQQMTEEVIERIQTLNAELSEPAVEGEQDQGIEEEKFREIETVFIIFSGMLDNLAFAGVHSRNALFLEKVEGLMERVQEINIVINFSCKLATYYREIGTTGKARTLVTSIIDIIDKEVEHVFLEDLFDFFLEFARNAIDLAYHEDDAWYVERLEHLYETIKTRKNLDEEDLESMQYQILSAMNSLLSTMWSEYHGKSLLQGFSSGID
ncbi:MAG: hypothetical protein GYA24_14415 [Candidatus Lokiarchaeota archaeon]|nr:hypothetical protein [Candidatus Lokiarchaeota archaeon]